MTDYDHIATLKAAASGVRIREALRRSGENRRVTWQDRIRVNCIRVQLGAIPEKLNRSRISAEDWLKIQGLQTEKEKT